MSDTSQPIGAGSVEERAAEVLFAHRHDIVNDLSNCEPRTTVALLADHGLLKDDDTARLVALGRAVEAMERRPTHNEQGAIVANYSLNSGWNDCLDEISRKGGE